MQKLLFLSFLFILPISCLADRKLVIETSDSKQIELQEEQEEILMQSQTIKDMLQEGVGGEDDTIIPLKQISENTFNKIMQCLELLAKMKRLEGEAKKEKESNLIEVLKVYSEEELFNVIQTTSYLNIPLLLEYGCKIWHEKYELSRFENNNDSFNNQEIIEKLKDINISSIKSFLIKKHLENYTPDVKTLIIKGDFDFFCVSLDGAQFAARLWGDDTMRIWDTHTGRCLNTLEGHGGIRFVQYSPDGTQLASVAWGDNTIRIWDAHTGQCLKILEDHTDVRGIEFVQYSPDGARLVSVASSNDTIRIWDAHTGECLKILEGHTEAKGIRFVQYSLDGTQFVSVSWDDTIRIWDAHTGECLNILEGHTEAGGIRFVQSPDGTQFVFLSSGDTMRIWDAHTGECLRTLIGHTGMVISASYSPDSTQIISASLDRTVRIWDATTGECLNILEGHTEAGGIRFVQYSPDGTQITSVSSNGTVRIWDAHTGECLRALEVYEKFSVSHIMDNLTYKLKKIHSICYSFDGNHLISTYFIPSPLFPSQTIRIWDIKKPARDLKSLSYKQLLLYRLCKKTIKKSETLGIVNNSRLLKVFNSLSFQQQALLKKITPMQLPLTKHILLRLYEYKKPIAAVGFAGLALYAGWKMLKN